MSDEVKKKRPGEYPPEVRERATHMVIDHQDRYPSQWKAIVAISSKIGVNHETVRNWVRRAETDAGERAGVTSDELAELKKLKAENKELRRANEILEAASASSGRSSTASQSDRGVHR